MTDSAIGDDGDDDYDSLAITMAMTVTASGIKSYRTPHATYDISNTNFNIAFIRVQN